MSVNAWMIVWKAVLVFAIGIFGLMAVWVTIAGLRDIRRLFTTLDDSHRGGSE